MVESGGKVAGGGNFLVRWWKAILPTAVASILAAWDAMLRPHAESWTRWGLGWLGWLASRPVWAASIPAALLLGYGTRWGWEWWRGREREAYPWELELLWRCRHRGGQVVALEAVCPETSCGRPLTFVDLAGKGSHITCTCGFNKRIDWYAADARARARERIEARLAGREPPPLNRPARFG